MCVVTAAEILARPGRVGDYIGARVCRDAAAHIDRLDPRPALPCDASRRHRGGRRRARRRCLVARRTAGETFRGRAGRSMSRRRQCATCRSRSRRPAYTGRPRRPLRNPSQLTVLEGSRLRVAVTADAATVTLETVSGPVSLSSPAAGMFVGEIGDRDRRVPGDPTRGARRPGRIAHADRPARSRPIARPAVRITAPGHDLFLADGSRAIDVKIEADDDLALASLTLTYTKASGAGENFEFVDGSVPVTLTKTRTGSGRRRRTGRSPRWDSTQAISSSTAASPPTAGRAQRRSSPTRSSSRSRRPGRSRPTASPSTISATATRSASRW